MLAVIAVLLYAASRPRGWDAVSAKRQAQTETILSDEASKIARHPVSVTCDDKGEFVGFVQDADGLAEVGGDQAFLTPEICDTLYQLAFKHRVQSFPRTARAIAVLAHESWHLRGEATRASRTATASRAASRSGRTSASRESRARAMMREQFATNASDSGSNSRVPRSERLPQRRPVRPAPDEPRFPYAAPGSYTEPRRRPWIRAWLSIVAWSSSRATATTLFQTPG